MRLPSTSTRFILPCCPASQRQSPYSSPRSLREAPRSSATGAVELLVLVAPMIPAPGEAPDSYWPHTRYSVGGAGPVRRCHRPLLPRCPAELAAQPLNRARIQSEARMGEPLPLRAWPDNPTRVLICRDDRLCISFATSPGSVWPSPRRNRRRAHPALSRPHELADRLEVHTAEQGLPVTASRHRRIRSQTRSGSPAGLR